MTNLFKKIAVSVSTIAMVAASFAFVGAADVNAAAAGEVYKTADGTVWFVTKEMTKRPFTSWGAFLTYGFLNQSMIKDADSSVNALPTGEFVKPADGQIFCASVTKGTDVAGECALITGGKKAAFTSAAVFAAQGFSFANANYGDSSFLEKTGNVDNGGAAHLPGTLVNNGGTVQMVVSGGLWGIPSQAVFDSWGYSYSDVVMANAADKSMTQVGVIPGRVAGELVPTGTTSNDDDDDNDGPLSGGAGDITISALSTYGDEEVGEDDEDVAVLAFEVEADDESDVEITSIKVELAQQNGADSVDLEDYASDVSVWMDDEEVGRADTDEFNESGDDYTKSISLDGAIIRSGETAEFVLAVSALSNLDSGDIDSDDWQIGVSSIRFVDGDGVSTTEALTLDIDDNVIDDTLEEEFDFASFATATNVELKVALNNDDEDINLAHVIDIDDTDDTDEVEILSFTIEADGDSDLLIEEIPATITTTGETDESVLVSNAQLWLDGDSIASDSVVAGGAVVFEDLEVGIDAGEMAEFTITVDVQDTTGAADNGDTVKAELTTVNVDAIVAEDESGERVVDADASGSAVGEAHALYDAGIMVEFVSASAERTFTADAATEDDQGTFKITFDVTAFDGDMRIDRSSEVADANAAGQGVEFSEVDTAGTPVLNSDILESNTVDSEDTADTFEVDEGTTRRFTLTVIYSADSTPTDGSVYVKIDSINWGTATDDTNANYYEFDLGDYKTDYLFLNGIA
jgi:hypothetical protein